MSEVMGNRAAGEDWTPSSWKTRQATQQPIYADPKRLAETVEKLSRLPPLVTSWEIETLKEQLAEAALGKQFLLQGGDCSESFEDCESPIIAIKLKILLQMSLVLIHGAQKQVIRMGSIRRPVCEAPVQGHGNT